MASAWLLLLLAAPPPDSRAWVVGQPSSADAALDARLAFLHERLASQRLHADIWWTSVMGVYSTGMVVQPLRGAFEEDPGLRADLVIGGAKSAIGVLRYGLQPFGGIQGPPEPTAGETHLDVLLAEEALRQNAEETEAFGPWYAHAGNVVVNVAGALIVGLGYGDWSAAWLSAGLGLAVGTTALLMQPWEADRDLAEYRQRFGGTLGR